MGRLSTHVLDTSRGKPAVGIEIRLSIFEGGDARHIKTTFTNGEGRTDEPLLADQHLAVGRYELVFGAGAYFRALGEKLLEPSFLDHVVIRFGIADASANWHVPLLISPYGYSTYRGS